MVAVGDSVDLYTERTPEMDRIFADSAAEPAADSAADSAARSGGQ